VFISFSFYRTFPFSYFRAICFDFNIKFRDKMIHIQRLILTIETRAHKGLLRIAINGLKDDDGRPITEEQRIGSQHEALDTLIRILEECKSNVHSSELQKLTRYIHLVWLLLLGWPFPPFLHFNSF